MRPAKATHVRHSPQAPFRSRPSDVAPDVNIRDWSAFEEAAVAAAEAVAAAAASDVAREAAVTAQIAVDAARAAADKAAHRARTVAETAADVQTALAVRRNHLDVAPPRGDDANGERGSADSNARKQTRVDDADARLERADRAAGLILSIAAAAATAAVEAALVVAAQLNLDLTAVADAVAVDPPPEDDMGVMAQAVANRDASAATPHTELPPAPDVGRDTTTIRQMTLQGASCHTIAAALNSTGSRTSSNARWTGSTVTKMLHRSSGSGPPDVPAHGPREG